MHAFGYIDVALEKQSVDFLMILCDKMVHKQAKDHMMHVLCLYSIWL